MQGTCGQARQVGMVLFSEPANTRDVLIGKEVIVDEDGGLRTQGMAGGNQKMLTLVSWIGCEQEVTANGFLYRRSRAGRTQGVGGWPVEGTDEQDGAVGLPG